MDLGLDIDSLTKPGRRLAAVGGRVLRELERADLELLALPGETAAVPLKRVSERHHALARALASGMTEGEAGAMLGFVPSRVSVLKASPAFRELLDLYRSERDAAFAETAARLAGLSLDAVLALQERLEEAPDEVTTGHLIEIAKMAADRSGNGPTSTQNHNLTVDLGERLKAARERARAAMIDVTPKEAKHG